MFHRRTSCIVIALCGLLLPGCRKDGVLEIPEPVYSVVVDVSGVVLPAGGRTEIPFRVPDGGFDVTSPGSRLSLLLRDGSAPENFRLAGVSAGVQTGDYIASIEYTGVSEAFSQEACLSLSFRSAAGADITLRSDCFCVNCGPTEYGWTGDTGLPVIYIDTAEGRPVDSRSVEIPAVLKVRGAGTYADQISASCNIRGRGNTTWIWDKKPYQVEFRDRVPMLGLPACNRWILLANFTDRTLMRNIVAMKVASLTCLDWTPRCVPVELVLNGRHAGNYLLIEKVEVDPERVDLSEDGFLLELDFHYDNEVQWIDPHGISTRRLGIPFAVKYPSPRDLKPERLEYIKKYVYDAAEAIYSDSFADPDKGYAAWIDVDSFIDYWLVYELLCNQELGNPGSVYFHQDGGGKLLAGPCWDFDWGMLRIFTDLQKRLGIANKKALWYERLFRDPAFEQRVRDRFAELLPVLQEIPDYIDECGALLEESARLNFAMWDPSEDRWQHQGILINGDENLSFSEAVASLRRVYLDRLGLLKDNL